MKSIFSVAFVLFAFFAFGQNLSSYQYVYVPKTFEGKNVNDYGLNQMLVKYLKAKKFTVLQDEPSNWPSDLVLDPCLVAVANLKDDSNIFTNRVLVEFVDCKKNKISEFKGKSPEKEFEAGFQDALKTALNLLPASNPTKKMEIDMTPVETPTVAAPAESSNKNLNSEKKGTTYSSNGGNYQLINLSAQQFILVKVGDTSPIATFITSSKSEVYHVKLSNGNLTLGYSENGNIVIDLPQNDGSFKKMVFNKN